MMPSFYTFARFFRKDASSVADTQGRYEVAFKALADGRHEFDFVLDDAFFAGIEHSMVGRGNLAAHVVMEKTEYMLRFDFEISGTVEATCDVCLGTFDYPVSTAEELIVKFGSRAEDDGEGMVVIDAADTEIDLTHWLYEFVCVSLPMRFEHPLDADGNPTCDAEMLEKLSHYLVSDAHTENNADSDTPASGSDPRWDVLKGLLNK